MQPKEINYKPGDDIPAAFEKKTDMLILEEAEIEALKLEQQEMGPLAKQMWNLMQVQKPFVFYTMRKLKTLAPYLCRLEDVLILNVTKLCQTGKTFEEARQIYLKEMMDELGLV